MASTLSNLYVERASSEHPIALWMLNEQVDYVSQITEDQRKFEAASQWDLTNAQAESQSSNEINAPFLDSHTSRIKGSLPLTANSDILLVSDFLLSNNLVEEYANFNIGFYIFLETARANTISVGYKYTDVETSETVEVLSTKNVTSRYRDNWVFISNTFDLPPDDSIAEDIKIVIKVNVSQGGIAGAYDFLINGLSVGQWSEEFNKTSYGVTPNPIPTNIALPSQLKSLPAFPYGASGQNGYYLSQDFRLFAKNFGVPLVFGSSNVTKITENVYNNINYPSLIFPGYGFLNKRGRYNDYTIEMWVRINSKTLGTKRIFGPIASTDGLYVDEAFLTLKIGTAVVSHFVGDWFRPMLIHIRVVGDSVFLVINGEEVGSVEINQETISLPDEFDIQKRSQDWIGFYAYEDIRAIEVDTFSIYSYALPTTVTKKRWVWGQAVTAPEQTNSSLNSVTAFNDYSFANYAANYNYPDFANWKQAYFSNVNAERKALSLPEYDLPDFRLRDKSVKDLFDDIKLIASNPLDKDDVLNREYITLSPNQEWTSESDYLYFENFGVLNEPVQTVYGVFKTDGTEENKTLIKITNKINNNNIKIFINNLTVTYQRNIDGVSYALATRTINANEKFSVGLDISKLLRSQDSAINRFFTEQSFLDMYVAGDGVSKFNGKIYKVGFDAAYNSRRTSWMYDDDGIIFPNISYTITDAELDAGRITFTTSEAHNYLIGDRVNILNVVSDPEDEFDLVEQEVVSLTTDSFTIFGLAEAEYISGGLVSDSANILYSHTANYTLTAINKYDLLFPDIAVAGYWEDYMPLSYFAKSITDFDLEQNYEIDTIQYDQDFPQPPKSAASLEVSIWNYGDLRAEYSSPVILTYEDLNNEFYTGWDNYEEMSQNSIRTSFYDTKDSTLRSYVSFQPILNGANKSLADFDSFAKPLTSGIIDPSATSLDWEKTAFEITSGTVIYPPVKTFSSNRSIDFERYALVYHLDFKSDGIFHNPVRFRELQLASQVLERTDFTPVGSRFGIPVYYYLKRGLYFDLKGKNPVSTYKKSTPYLYLDRNSGWKIQGDFDSETDRGIAIPVNLSAAGDKDDPFEVSSIQMWIRFSDRDFPLDPVMIFSIDHNDAVYDFFVQSDASEKRGLIFAVDRDSAEIIDEIQYYINGQSVGVPFLVRDEWAVLGLEFGQLLDFSSRVGLINLNGPLTYNSVSYNLATNIEKSKLLETRAWSDMPKLKVSDVEGIQTSVVSNVSYVTYTTDSEPGTFVAGQKVSVFGISPPQFNFTNLAITSASGNSFTVANPATGTYISGGTVESGTWQQVKNVFAIDQNQYSAWQQVKAINESITFNIDPKAIYEKYTGSNRTVIDDESRGILIDPERIKIFKEVTWSENLKIPV